MFPWSEPMPSTPTSGASYGSNRAPFVHNNVQKQSTPSSYRPASASAPYAQNTKPPASNRPSTPTGSAAAPFVHSNVPRPASPASLAYKGLSSPFGRDDGAKTNGRHPDMPTQSTAPFANETNNVEHSRSKADRNNRAQQCQRRGGRNPTAHNESPFAVSSSTSLPTKRPISRGAPAGTHHANKPFATEADKVSISVPAKSADPAPWTREVTASHQKPRSPANKPSDMPFVTSCTPSTPLRTPQPSKKEREIAPFDDTFVAPSPRAKTPRKPAGPLTAPYATAT